ncbi:MAG: arylsulfatase [Acidimicrobiales bacterium]|nr:arylsulfatase [Acidimicrobiales bacterium]
MPSEHPNRPYQDFGGSIGTVVGTSTPDWPARPKPGPSAPNVVIMLADDLGYADLGCYGSEIDTPHLDAVAENGLQFTNFHVMPMCSPTRAAMLTGLNAHLAGVGHVCHSDPGFPGYAMELTDRAATLAELFRDNGYATMMVGKWHLTKDSDLDDSSPKHSWPVQKGFERFYGILDGFTNFHHPHRLYRDNHHVDIDRYPDDYYFTDDITDEAISMIQSSKAGNPNKPFFLYFSHGAVHAPLQAKAADIEKYRGVYDAGWDDVRAARFRRQLEIGVIPADTPLPPRNHEQDHDVEAWDDLSPERRELFARYMEVFAGMVDSIDQSVGRLLSTLETLGELDNTIFVFTSDNGGSREGEVEGTSSYFDALRYAANRDGGYASFDFDHDRLDLIGGPQTLPHYPRGWAMVSNTPFRLYKINTHAGGHQVPMLVQWPAANLPAGERRTQYQHVTDLMPTLLEAAGIDRPAEHGGEAALPLAGASMAPVLQDADAESTHREQYYEMIGHRGYYRDGWEAVTMHLPATKFGDHEWELYHLEADPTEVNDLAADMPEKVAELAAAFDDAAWANQVYPLDEGTGLKMIQRPPTEAEYEVPVRILPGTPTLERFRCLTLINMRAFTVTIELGSFSAGDRGYLVAHGDQGGGYALGIDGDEVEFVYNEYGRISRVRSGPLDPSTRRIVLDMESTTRTEWNARILVDGTERGRLDNLPVLFAMAPFQGIDVGLNRRSPVDWGRYVTDGTFAYTGDLRAVTYTPGDRPPDHGNNFLDFLRELGAKYE